MQVQVNSNNSVNMTENMIRWASDQVREELDRFANKITRVEVHLNDLNGHKEGETDKYCSIEVRLKGMQPLASNHRASSFDFALKGGLDKLLTVLSRAVDKIEHKKGRTPFGGEPFAELKDDIDFEGQDQ